MHLIYIDDSKDSKLAVFSALAIPAKEWQSVFQQIRRFRRELRDSDGIFVYKEFHAWKFISGRGKISDRIVSIERRCEIFKEALKLVAHLPGVRSFNALYPPKKDEQAFEQLLNCMNRAMQAWDSHAILVCDEGREETYTRLRRRMGDYNPVPSRYGRWEETGATMKDIPIDRIIEDPFFKDSEQSYLIQLVDFCAYSLLRRERPIPSKTKYGLDRAFELLSPILVKEATRGDPEGMIRL